MSERFIKLNDSEKTRWLLLTYPNAFLLLTLIALRARRISGHIDGLEIGEAEIGDWKSCGLTQKQYRTAKDVLTRYKIIEIVETRRNCKKTATRRATKGTLVKLLNSDILDINIEETGDSKGDQGATKGRLKGDEQERIKNEYKNEERIVLLPQQTLISQHNIYSQTYAPQAAAEPSPCRASKIQISFSFAKSAFENITPDDIAAWKEAYPGVDIAQQLRAMQQWILANRDRSPRSRWRSFIIRWLTKSQNQLSYGKQAPKIENSRAVLGGKRLTEYDNAW